MDHVLFDLVPFEKHLFKKHLIWIPKTASAALGACSRVCVLLAGLRIFAAVLGPRHAWVNEFSLGLAADLRNIDFDGFLSSVAPWGFDGRRNAPTWS